MGRGISVKKMRRIGKQITERILNKTKVVSVHSRIWRGNKGADAGK